MTSKGLRLLAYGRVSDVRGRSGESFISPEDQMAKCRAYAEAYEHTILEEGLDLDISGGVMSRPVLDRFLAKIRDGEAQGLIVAKLDRFSRSSRGALNALAEIETAGGVLISVQEQIDSTTAAGRFVRAIFLATAEWERERIGENWTSAQKAAVARGVHISRHVPPGYQRNKNGVLIPHPWHGKTIHEAFELAAKGMPYARIADYLNERELPSGDNGSVWQANRIKRLLANRVYLGEARYGDISNPKAHKPLVDEATFHLAQRKRGTVAASSGGSYLLSGIVRCAACSYAMRPQKARGKTIGTYRCVTNHASGRCDHPSSISMERLDDFVFSAFAKHLASTPSEPRERPDDTLLRAELEEAQAKLSEVLADEDKLRAYGVFEQARDAALNRIEVAQRALASPLLVDTEGLAEEMMEKAKLLEGVRALDSLDNEAKGILRGFMAQEIQAVFVRPAKSRSNRAPIEERVRTVWRDEEPLELPRRGERFEPRAYVWA
jgi:site-specific DNA recombinase